MESMQQLWGGDAGRAWVDTQELLDRLFEPFEQILVAEARGDVLDVGCGAGATTRAVGGSCTGIDISAPMIAAAQQRSAGQFICADAQTYPFLPASVDTIISRFGVMFFADPVAAFTNLHHAARGGATCALITWRCPEDNPFMVAAERAAAPLLPDLPIRKKDEPGQFGLADPVRINDILTQSGWRNIEIKPLDVECAMPEGDLIRYIARLGPVGLALAKADGQTRPRVIETMRPAFEPFRRGGEIRFNAACWMIRARKPTSQSTPTTRRPSTPDE